MQTRKGDLIVLAKEGYFDFIFHGANCFCKMRSGVAKEIALNFPEAVAADLATKRGDKEKLGNFTIGKHKLKDPLSWLGVVNLYTQYDYGYDGRDRFNYPAFGEGLCALSVYLATYHLMKATRSDIPFDGKLRVGFPKVGTGLAGGNWEEIEATLKKFERRTEKYCELTLVLK